MAGTYVSIGLQEAEQLARQDQLWLLRERKLALIVDLDQTLIHTAISPGIEGGLPVSVSIIPSLCVSLISNTPNKQLQ